MIVTLSFNPLGGEIISGIPRFIEIESSSPATIYYTLDGYLPSQLSNVYTGPIEMPTDKNSVTLSAVGYYLDGYSNLVPTPVLSNRYFTDVSDLIDNNASSSKFSEVSGRSRFLFFEGIVYMFPGGLNIPFWYDSSGEASVFVDIPIEELDLLTSTRNRDGSIRNNLFDVEKVPPSETASLRDDNYQLFDKPDSDTFNPEALYIVIDGREGDSLDNTLILNGPHLDLRDPTRNYRGIDFYTEAEANYRSGSMVGYHINRDNETIVFYYNDTNNGRWIKSIQRLEPAPPPSNFSYKHPIVFEWFNFGRHGGIYR